MRMKRIWSLLAALFLIVALTLGMAGCGGAAAGGGGEVKGYEAASETVQKEIEAEAQSELEAQSEPGTQSELEAQSEAETQSEPAIDEAGTYTSKEEVALYLHTYGKLPSNYITKKEAEALGWKKKQGEAGQLQTVAPGMSIGGDHYGNYEELLPEKKGRKYFECDINYVSGNRGAERIIYSNDGLIFYTGDHYKHFEQMYP